MPKVLIVCTSATSLNGHTTGLWLEELAAPYYQFHAAEYEVVLASPAGGPIPIDAASLGEGFFTHPAKKFLHDPIAVGELSHSKAIGSVDITTVDAIYLTGGHGAVADFVGQPPLKVAIEALYGSGKVVGAVCHGVIALVECVDGGKPLVEGKTMTAFTNAEEEAVQLTKIVPFPLETKFVELGAKFEKGTEWSKKVCVDGKLVTGQNPQSSKGVADAIMKLLG